MVFHNIIDFTKDALIPLFSRMSLIPLHLYLGLADAVTVG